MTNYADFLGDDFEAEETSLRRALTESIKRKEAIETLRPQVKFARLDDGSHNGFGILPEQAVGTIDGHPFYFRFRYDTARLEVWPVEVAGETIPVDSVPHAVVAPILASEMSDVTGEEYASTHRSHEENLELFLHLVDNLSSERASSRRIRRSIPDEVLRLRLVKKLSLAFPFLTQFDLTTLPGPMVRLPSGALLLLSTVEDAVLRGGGDEKNPTLLVDVFLQGHLGDSGKAGLSSSAPLPSVDAESVTTAFIAALDSLSGAAWVYETYTSNLDKDERVKVQQALIDVHDEISDITKTKRLDDEARSAIIGRAELSRMDILDALFNSKK